MGKLTSYKHPNLLLYSRLDAPPFTLLLLYRSCINIVLNSLKEPDEELCLSQGALCSCFTREEEEVLCGWEGTGLRPDIDNRAVPPNLGWSQAALRRGESFSSLFLHGQEELGRSRELKLK